MGGSGVIFRFVDGLLYGLCMTFSVMGNFCRELYHVCAFDFPGKEVHFGTSLFTDPHPLIMLKVILRWRVQCLDVTNLVGSMFHSLRIVLGASPLRIDIVAIFVPILIMYAESGARTAVASSSTLFLANLDASRRARADVDRILGASSDFPGLWEEHLRKCMTCLNDACGAPITKGVKKTPSINELKKLRTRSFERCGSLSPPDIPGYHVLDTH
jgi:hypothetical protein